MSDSVPRIWLTTLGCAKNQVDSEKITARLGAAGYREADGPEDADVVMINTCGFIEAARRESIETVLEAAAAKRPDARLGVQRVRRPRLRSPRCHTIRRCKIQICGRW